MKRESLAAGLAAFVVGLGLTCAAHAKTYEFNISTAEFKIEGDVTTSGHSSYVDGYDVTGISGTVQQIGDLPISIDALVMDQTGDTPYTGGTGAAWIFDNVLYPDISPVVDYYGILFSAGGYDYNVYTIGTTYYVSTLNPAGQYNPGEVLLSGTVTAVPELQTWAMMGIGFAGLGLAGAGRAKKSRAAVVAA